MRPRAIVFGVQPGDLCRAGRTLRSLEAVGLAGEFVPELTSEKLLGAFGCGESLLLLRAGSWLANTAGFALPHPSATGKGLCAFGMTGTPRESEPETKRVSAVWRKLLNNSGGDLGLVSPRSSEALELPAPSSHFFSALYFDPCALAKLAVRPPSSFDEMISLALHDLRFVHFQPLDVYQDRGLRVIQLITSLQRGGAERVTLDLMSELPVQNVRARLVTTGRPLRDSFPTPPGTLDLAAISRNAQERADVLRREGIAFGADLIHGHLIPREDCSRICAGGLPLMLTVHNTQAGWPQGLAALQTGDAVLVVACAQAVERDVVAAKLPIPARTVRNGIDLGAFQLTPERVKTGQAWRQEWGFGETDFVMVAVANPRPQKRLHLLPGVLAALRSKLSGNREARLIFCGEALPGNEEAERCVRETCAETTRLGLEAHVRWMGPVAEVADMLAAANVLVSTSAHEGLSLAQLEALAMGRPVVATDVGGVREIARDNPSLHLLPTDAPSEQFADELFSIAGEQCPSKPRDVLKHWSRAEMAARYRWLYHRVAATSGRSRRGEGLWLIANNFSTGGAQSSARRLLTGLAAQGVRVRAAVVEEDPAHPTPGRNALLQAGIPVIAVSPASPTASACERLLEAIDADPPQTVVFWNLRPSFKVLLADALIDTRVFDVSPGEMFFDSLEKYFDEQRSSLPYYNSRDYGARLAGVVVKYRAEAARAAQVLGAPVHVIPNGVPMAFSPALIRRSESERLAFSTAARINPQKRLEDLLEAFRIAHNRLPDYTLKIAGGIERGCDDYANRLRALGNGLPVEWLGEMTDISGFHRQSDLFVMISEPAGCPNASLEAMAAGLPVIATDIGGASEQVIDRRTGRLVPPRNPLAFAEALVELATQPEARREMGAAAHGRIRDHFGLDRMVADYRCLLLPDDS